MQRNRLTLSGFFFAFLIVSAASAFCFEASDLTGSWNFYTLTTDATGGGEPAWERVILTIDDEGQATEEWEASDGSSGSIELGQIEISSDGVVAMTDPDSDFHGRMSPDKNFIAATETRNEGKTAFGGGVKNSAGFSLTDLEGSWDVSSLWAAADGTSAGSEKVILTVDETGQADVNGDPSEKIQIEIDEDGPITIPEFEDFEGKISPGKNLFAFTAKDTNNNIIIAISLKTETGFLTSDLKGTWDLYTFETDGSSIEKNQGILTIDDQGNATLDYWFNLDLAISSDGIVTITDRNSDFQGRMSSDKGLIVSSTSNPEDGKAQLFIFFKISSEIINQDNGNGDQEDDPEDNGNGDQKDDHEDNGNDNTGDDNNDNNDNNNNNNGNSLGGKASSTCFLTAIRE